jgi:predicted amidohydrolase
MEACAATGSLALAGAPVNGDGDQPHIGILAIDGAGASIAYRKIWLGGHEPEWFAPGSDPTVIDVDGWGLGLAICRDTSAPEHAAATAALGIEAYVAGVLESAEDAAVPAERARRIAAEHGVWVAMASFAGSTGGGYESAAGRSGIWGPDGNAVAEAGAGIGEIARATLAP